MTCFQNSSSPSNSTCNFTDADITWTEHHGHQFYAVVYAVVALSIIVTLCLRGLVFMLVSEHYQINTLRFFSIVFQRRAYIV
jgi:hypothetical protein